MTVMSTATAPWPAPLPAPLPGTAVPYTYQVKRLPPIVVTREERSPTGWLLLALVATMMFAAAFIGFFAGRASALPLCGGNQAVKTVPVTCTNSKTIDGTLITVVLNVTTSGQVTATYTLDAPRQVDTPIRVRSHRGISSNPMLFEVSGVIPAGATTGTLTTTLDCGQIDVKAVFVGNGDARGRVAAPFVTKPGNCTETVNSTTTTTIVTTTTTGGSTTTAATTTTVPGEATSTTPATAPATLPGTGGGDHRGLGVLAAVLLVLAGVGLVVWSRLTPERS